MMCEPSTTSSSVAQERRYPQSQPRSQQELKSQIQKKSAPHRQQKTDSRSVNKSPVQRNDDFIYFLHHMFQEKDSAHKDESTSEAYIVHNQSETSNEYLPTVTRLQTFSGGEIKSSQIMIKPTSSDVLNGRGKRANNHEGNIRFREIVLKNKRDYVMGSSSKIRKHSIIAKVMSDIHNLDPPGRFLELNEKGVWKAISDKRARKKIGQALREDARIFNSCRPNTPPQDNSLDQVGSTSSVGPTSNDVLCGRGKRIDSHEGNIRFRDIVSKKKQEYLANSTTYLRKFHIALDVVTEIQKLEPPGRFLELDSKSGLWVDIGDVRARKKAGKALREDSKAFCREREI